MAVNISYGVTMSGLRYASSVTPDKQGDAINFKVIDYPQDVPISDTDPVVTKHYHYVLLKPFEGDPDNPTFYDHYYKVELQDLKKLCQIFADASM